MTKFTKTGHYISRRIGKAIGDYDMIRDGDKILVGVSGGKDSLTLLKLLRERQRWSPVKYELFCAHVRTDTRCAACVHAETLEELFKKFEVAYRIKEIRVLDKEGKTSCFWCSWNRRKALFETAKELGCTKIALGHHKDDIVETTLLNMFFHGEFASMNPRQELFKGAVVIIRPLCSVEEKMTRKFAKENDFPSQLCRCPFSQDSKRKLIKEFLNSVARDYPYIKTNIFNSASRIKGEYLQLKPEGSSDLVHDK